MPPDSPLTKTVQKALQIIDVLAHHDSLGVTEIARQVGMHKSTVYRLLATLAQAGYVRQNSASEKYTLGLKFLEVAGLILNQLDLVKLAEPYLEELMIQTGETINLAVLDRGQCLYLKTIQGPHALSMIARPSGWRDAAHSTALGKALLAFLPEEELQDLLSLAPLTARTERTIVDPDQLKQTLAEVRSRGFALDDMENDENVRCLGCPIFNHTEMPVAAVSVSGPAFRIDGARIPAYARLVQKAAADVSRRLGSRSRWRSVFGSGEGQAWALRDPAHNAPAR